LQTTQWLRLFLGSAIALTALWIEFRPEPTAEYLFAASPIAAGERIDANNSETRIGPSGLLQTATLGDIVLSGIEAGDPILASSAGELGRAVPAGWWLLELPMPESARLGQAARVVLIDAGQVVDSVVAGGVSDDELGDGTGLVAVAPADVAEVAAAAAGGRAVVLVASD